MPAIPSWLLEPLRDQFSALLPARPVYDPSHPLGCHRPRISDRIIFEKLLQVLRFGCSYASIADCTCAISFWACAALPSTEPARVVIACHESPPTAVK